MDLSKNRFENRELAKSFQSSQKMSLNSKLVGLVICHRIWTKTHSSDSNNELVYTYIKVYRLRVPKLNLPSDLAKPRYLTENVTVKGD